MFNVTTITRRVYTSGEHLYYLTSTGEWMRLIEDDEGLPTSALACGAPASPALSSTAAPAIEAGSPSEDYYDAWHAARIAEELEEVIDAVEGSVVAGGGSWACFLGTAVEGEDGIACVLAVGDSPEQAMDLGRASDYTGSEPYEQHSARFDALVASGAVHVRPCTRRFFSAFSVDEETAATLTEQGRVDLTPAGVDGWDAPSTASIDHAKTGLRMVN